MLLRAGVDPMTTIPRNVMRRYGRICSDTKGKTAVEKASSLGHVNTLKVLAAVITREQCNQAICWAAEKGRVAIIDFLLNENLASADALLNGNTALYLAAFSADPDCVARLLQGGADAGTLSRGNNNDLRHVQATPLHGLVMGAQDRKKRYRDSGKDEKYPQIISAITQGT